MNGHREVDPIRLRHTAQYLCSSRLVRKSDVHTSAFRAQGVSMRTQLPIFPLLSAHSDSFIRTTQRCALIGTAVQTTADSRSSLLNSVDVELLPEQQRNNSTRRSRTNGFVRTLTPMGGSQATGRRSSGFHGQN